LRGRIAPGPSLAACGEESEGWSVEGGIRRLDEQGRPAGRLLLHRIRRNFILLTTDAGLQAPGYGLRTPAKAWVVRHEGGGLIRS